MAFLLRYLLFGPVAGIGVAIVQSMADVAVWVGHGSPDFYFQGWNAMLELAVLRSVAGFLVGLPYGLAICSVNEAWGVRPGQFLICLWLIAFLVQLVVTSFTFAVRPQLMFLPLLPEIVTASSGLILLITLPSHHSSEIQLSEDQL